MAVFFKINSKTIKAPTELTSLSYPIYTTQGNGGGVHVVDGFRMGRKYMSEEQVILLEKLATKLTGADLKTMQEILKTFKEPKRGNK